MAAGKLQAEMNGRCAGPTAAETRGQLGQEGETEQSLCWAPVTLVPVTVVPVSVAPVTVAPVTVAPVTVANWNTLEI